VFPVPESITPDVMAEFTTLEALEETLLEAAREAYEAKKQSLTTDLMHMAERRVMLRAIDTHWQRHLTDLDVLREGIGLMSIAQRDPLVEYKREAFAMFNQMRAQIDRQALQDVFRVQVTTVQRQPAQRQMVAARPTVAGAVAEAKPEPARVQRKIGRNDPCWCGSGKKYKNCHLKADQGSTAAS
jgi:preprotein translocase subunit SecA